MTCNVRRIVTALRLSTLCREHFRKVQTVQVTLNLEVTPLMVALSPGQKFVSDRRELDRRLEKMVVSSANMIKLETALPGLGISHEGPEDEFVADRAHGEAEGQDGAGEKEEKEEEEQSEAEEPGEAGRAGRHKSILFVMYVRRVSPTLTSASLSPAM